MVTLETLNEINEYLREYFRYHNMSQSTEILEQEIKSKQMARRLRNDMNLYGQLPEPRLHSLFKPVS